MKKTFAFMAALAFIGGASAQQAIYAANSGRVANDVAVYAGSSGAGTSTAHAESAANAFSNGAVSALPGAIAMSGSVGGMNTGSAYVIGTGAGYGSGAVNGWSDAGFVANASSAAPTGHVSGSISIDGGMQNAVRNGSDLHIAVGTNQSAFGAAQYDASASLVGAVGQVGIPGGAVLVGSLADNKVANASTSSGQVTFTGANIPAGMSLGGVTVNAGAQASVSGEFLDPAH